jgi:glycosyltransferase involved in cell wall biosynthesis
VLTQLLTTAPAGGIELCTRQDSRALVQRGHHVDIAYGTDVAYGIDTQCTDDIEAAGIEMFGPFPFACAPRSAPQDIARFIPAVRWARSRHGDVLWLNRFEHIVWAQVVSRAARIPVVCQLHNVPTPGYSRWVRQLGQGVAHFIAVSEFMRRTWIDSGVAPDRISVVHNAVPTAEYGFAGSAERLSASARLGFPGGAVVLYYGRILPDKGVGVLLDAWRRLDLSRRPATLVLVGSPEPTADAAIAEKVKQVNPATLRWFPMQAGVVPFLHAADVVIFPSLMPEAFGRVVIEAMSTGRPVIASRAGAVPEILKGPMARFLVEPGDAGELAAAMDSLLDWRTTEPELAQLCADWVAVHFPYDVHVDQLERLLLRYARCRMS